MAVARRNSVTLVDVAKKAGVSTVVASAVINGSRTSARVAPGTRDRVMEVAREMRYVPNAAAQSLTKPGMSMLGIAFNRTEFSFITHSYVARLTEGILDTAIEKSFTVALFPEPWVDAQHSAGPYGNRRTDGIIIMAPSLNSDMVPELVAMGLPIVVTSAPGDAWGVPAVMVDNTRGGQLAAEHLLSLGHRRIGYLSVDQEEYIFDAKERRQGFLGTLAAAGCPARNEHIAPGNFNFNDGYAAATALLSQAEPPTALFAANDFSALGAMRAAHDVGVSVPGDLSVIGFDDVPEAASVSPALTTIRSPWEALGKQAAKMLIRLIAEGIHEPVTYRQQPELIVRGSTAPPRRAAQAR